MQTIKTGREFTGFVIGKCKNGHTSRYEVGKFWFNTGNFSRRENCTTDGCERVMRLEFCKPVYGRFVEEVICNGKCMSATGDNCECSCGGMNHGGGHAGGW